MSVLLFLLIPVIALSEDFFFFKKVGYEELIGDVEKAKIVYLGEAHDREDVHRFQLKVIEDLSDRGYDLIILMEAFQQPFQDALDEYVNGEISEEEMLERTEYRSRWHFAPKLYAPIWRFAREKELKLFALNVPTELLNKVRELGLTKVRSRYLPKKIMPIHKKHKEFLKEIMSKHKNSDEKRFFEIQQTWDMGMAYRVAKVALGNPNAKLVVIVGAGHVWRGYGIPERVNFLIGEIPQTVLYVDGDEIHFLFSKDFSKESSSTNSRREPN